LANRLIDLRIVVVDNNGGGIFGFLAQGSQLAFEQFEQLFGTPHGTDLALLAQAHHLPCQQPTTVDELVGAISNPGVSVTIVKTDRWENLAVHDRIHAAVSKALRANNC
jgi:2-succinyl-5-enolpyruvyl-6-hydroxy-3-cyclohexene-1-carboxylate synthase